MNCNVVGRVRFYLLFIGGMLFYAVVNAQESSINQYVIYETEPVPVDYVEFDKAGLFIWGKPRWELGGSCEVRARYIDEAEPITQEFVLVPPGHEHYACADDLSTKIHNLSMARMSDGKVVIAWHANFVPEDSSEASIGLYVYLFDPLMGKITKRRRYNLDPSDVTTIPESMHMFYDDEELLRILDTVSVATIGAVNSLQLRFMNIDLSTLEFDANTIQNLQMGKKFIFEPASGGLRWYFEWTDPLTFEENSGVAEFDGFSSDSLVEAKSPAGRVGSVERTLLRDEIDGMGLVWVDGQDGSGLLHRGYMDASGDLAGRAVAAPELPDGCFGSLESMHESVIDTFYFSFFNDCSGSGKIYTGRINQSLELDAREVVSFIGGSGLIQRLKGSPSDLLSMMFEDTLDGTTRLRIWDESVFGDRFSTIETKMSTRVSIDSEGREAGFEGVEGYMWGSASPAISGDGRFIAYSSWSNNLVTGSQNGLSQVYLFDRAALEAIRISEDYEGNPGDLASFSPGISGDGQRVVFHSRARNLGLGNTNGFSDIFLYFQIDQSIIQLSQSFEDGPEPNGSSFRPRISKDGNVVSFSSTASNLVPGDNNGARDIFVVTIGSVGVDRVSVTDTGNEANADSRNTSLSEDGRFVVFSSDATNLVADDTNGVRDVFVRDRVEEKTYRVSTSSQGEQAMGGNSGSPDISADGRFVTFESAATNLVSGDMNAAFDVFVHDRTTGVTERINTDSEGGEVDGISRYPSISDDGFFIVYSSSSDSLVADDSNGYIDIFAHNRSDDTTRRVNLGLFEADPIGGDSYFAKASGDGISVVYGSEAENLVPVDENGELDIFVVDLKERFSWLH